MKQRKQTIMLASAGLAALVFAALPWVFPAISALTALLGWIILSLVISGLSYHSGSNAPTTIPKKNFKFIGNIIFSTFMLIVFAGISGCFLYNINPNNSSKPAARRSIVRPPSYSVAINSRDHVFKDIEPPPPSYNASLQGFRY